MGKLPFSYRESDMTEKTSGKTPFGKKEGPKAKQKKPGEKTKKKKKGQFSKLLH